MKIRTLGLLLLLAGPILMVGSVHAASGSGLNNNIEGNWTSWTLYNQISIASFSSSFTTGTEPMLFQTTDGASLIFFLGSDNSIYSYSISAKSISKIVANLNFPNSVDNTFLHSMSMYGQYIANVDSSGDLLIFKNGVQLQKIDPTVGGWQASGLVPTMDQTGQWIVIRGTDSTSGVLSLWFYQGIGNPASTPLTSVIGNGQNNYVYGGATTTLTNINALGGNYTGAQQQIQANPLPYGLIALIIILTIGAAIYLRFTDKSKGGFRQPRTNGRGYRGP